VLADSAVLVEDPTDDPGLLALERGEHLSDGRALELELAAAARQLGQRRTQSHDGHGPILERITM
jgi:hypothetical protein